MSVSLRHLDPKNKNSTNSEWWTDERIEKWDFRGWAQVSNVLVQHQQASGVMRAPWNRYPKCRSRPTTTTTTTKQDLESYRWLVTNCKYSFPAWRHANLAVAKCALCPIQAAKVRAKGILFFWITMIVNNVVNLIPNCPTWYDLITFGMNKCIKGTHPLPPPFGMLTDGWSWNCTCSDWQQLSPETQNYQPY